MFVSTDQDELLILQSIPTETEKCCSTNYSLLILFSRNFFDLRLCSTSTIMIAQVTISAKPTTETVPEEEKSFDDILISSHFIFFTQQRIHKLNAVQFESIWCLLAICRRWEQPKTSICFWCLSFEIDMISCPCLFRHLWSLLLKQFN